MSEIDRQRQKRPVVWFAGFAVPSALLLWAVAAYRSRYFDGMGWHGGEYAFLFVGIAMGAIVVGVTLGLTRPWTRWSSFGAGMAVAGLVGVVIAMAGVALLFVALSRWDW